jgi:hypothetical protein
MIHDFALLQTLSDLGEPSISRPEWQGKYALMPAMSEAQPISKTQPSPAFHFGALSSAGALAIWKFTAVPSNHAKLALWRRADLTPYSFIT